MFGADVCRGLMDRIDTNIYSFEEIINILRRLKVNYSPNQMWGYLKMLLDKKIEVKEQRELLDEISSKFNNGKELPVVIDDYTGKILTGIVWYCEQLEKYAENEDDFNDEGFEYLANQAYEEGYTDDDGVEYAENNWENLGIYEIDLDKECNWTDNGRWSELFDEFVNESREEQNLTSQDMLNESFNNKELAEEIKKHGGLKNSYKDLDARKHLINFDLKNSKYSCYLNPKFVNDIYYNNAYRLLYKSIDNILYTNDGGIIIIDSINDDYDEYKKWKNKMHMRNDNWIEDRIKENPEEDYWDVGKTGDSTYKEPYSNATIMRRRKHRDSNHK